MGWIITAYPDGSFDSTEMACGGWCGVQSRTRPAGFAESYIYDPSGTPVEIDDAEFVSETIPDGTHFNPGEAFVGPFATRVTRRGRGEVTMCWPMTEMSNFPLPRKRCSRTVFPWHPAQPMTGTLP
jgi:hypothetical protein